MAVGGVRMGGKVSLAAILTMAALLSGFPAHAQEQRAGCPVTAAVEETGGQAEGQTGEPEEAGEPAPSTPAMASQQTGQEDDDALAGQPEQNGRAEVFLGVDPGSVFGWAMLLLFLLLFLLFLLLCLATWLTRRKADREQRGNMREK